MHNHYCSHGYISLNSIIKSHLIIISTIPVISSTSRIRIITPATTPMISSVLRVAISADFPSVACGVTVVIGELVAAVGSGVVGMGEHSSGMERLELISAIEFDNNNIIIADLNNYRNLKINNEATMYVQ